MYEGKYQDLHYLKFYGGTTFKSQGIPCIHALMELQRRQLPLEMCHFNHQWWLKPILEPLDPRLLLQELAVVRTRGRPAGSQNRPGNDNSTRRDPSGFEYTEVDDKAGDKTDGEVDGDLHGELHRELHRSRDGDEDEDEDEDGDADGELHREFHGNGDHWTRTRTGTWMRMRT
jgi:hypothetical protein